MPDSGKGIFQKFLILAKYGSQTRKVGIKTIRPISMSLLTNFIT